ncbi:MAG: hypothetical protein ACREBS_05910 [Nitrososphaerales archaeon]
MLGTIRARSGRENITTTFVDTALIAVIYFAFKAVFEKDNSPKVAYAVESQVTSAQKLLYSNLQAIKQVAKAKRVEEITQ